jgi:hypothetical protein
VLWSASQVGVGAHPYDIVDAIVGEYRNEFGSDPANIPLQAIVFSAEKSF